VVERTPDGDVRVLHDSEHVTGLGRGVDREGALSEAAIERAFAALAVAVARARALGVDHIGVVGTSAMRDASNRATLLERTERELGLELQVIDGAREAEWTFRGALPSLPAPSGRFTVADLGGGSTEIVVGDRRAIEAAWSLDVGSVRLHERHLRSDPPTAAEQEALLADVDAAIARAGARFQGPLIALAGTACTVAALARGAPSDASAVHGAIVTEPELRAVTRDLVARTAAERRVLPGVPAGRHDVLAAGALLLTRLVHHAAVPSITVSHGGVRWGLALALLGQDGSTC
jgi:exopolyphosphatase / guanosine-5'-triphosphate,3'-diphosphate pyrophosphatase